MTTRALETDNAIEFRLLPDHLTNKETAYSAKSFSKNKIQHYQVIEYPNKLCLLFSFQDGESKQTSRFWASKYIGQKCLRKSMTNYRFLIESRQHLC